MSEIVAKQTKPSQDLEERTTGDKKTVQTTQTGNKQYVAERRLSDEQIRRVIYKVAELETRDQVRHAAQVYNDALKVHNAQRISGEGISRLYEFADAQKISRVLIDEAIGIVCPSDDEVRKKLKEHGASPSMELRITYAKCFKDQFHKALLRRLEEAYSPLRVIMAPEHIHDRYLERVKFSRILEETELKEGLFRKRLKKTEKKEPILTVEYGLEFLAGKFINAPDFAPNIYLHDRTALHICSDVINEYEQRAKMSQELTKVEVSRLRNFEMEVI